MLDRVTPYIYTHLCPADDSATVLVLVRELIYVQYIRYREMQSCCGQKRRLLLIFLLFLTRTNRPART